MRISLLPVLERDSRRLTPRLQSDANLRFAPVGAAEPQSVRRYSDHSMLTSRSHSCSPIT